MAVMLTSEVSYGDMKSVLFRLHPKLHRQLRQLALDQDTTLQALAVEGLEWVLEERQKRAHGATAQTPASTTRLSR